MRRIAYSAFVAVVLTIAAGLRASADAPPVILNPQNTITLPSDPQGAMQKARERVAAGNLVGAITGLQSYVETHPGEISPERLLGDLYYRKGELSRAEATYRHILSYAPGDKETHNRLGSVFATENRIDDAIAEFNRSLPGTDSVPDLVRLHMRKGDLDSYKRDKQRIADTFPTDPEAQSELGEVYEATNLPEVAIRYFRRALDVDPGSLIALNGLGLSYMDEHSYAQAVAQFKTCLLHDAYNYACMDNMGATYLETGQFSQADTILHQAHQLYPERGEALVNLGYLTDSRGDWKRAVAYYVEAMTVYPYSPDAYIDLGYTYNAHGLYQLAQSALIKGLAVDPEDGRLHFLLGDAYARQGNNALAAAQYRAAAVAQNLDPGVKRVAQERVAALEHPRPNPKATPY
jgi:tetratricopeptide (TPR) repeat protein